MASPLEKNFFLELVRQGDERAAGNAYLHWGSVMANAADYSQQEEEAAQRQDAAEKAKMAIACIKDRRPIEFPEYNWRYAP